MLLNQKLCQMRIICTGYLVVICVCGVAAVGQTSGTTDANIIESQPFVLSASATAKGIDGKIQLGLTISAAGKASDIRIYGGPMWPCGTDPGDEAGNVREAV